MASKKRKVDEITKNSTTKVENKKNVKATEGKKTTEEKNEKKHKTEIKTLRKKASETKIIGWNVTAGQVIEQLGGEKNDAFTRWKRILAIKNGDKITFRLFYTLLSAHNKMSTSINSHVDNGLNNIHGSGECQECDLETNLNAIEDNFESIATVLDDDLAETKEKMAVHLISDDKGNYVSLGNPSS